MHSDSSDGINILDCYDACIHGDADAVLLAAGLEGSLTMKSDEATTSSGNQQQNKLCCQRLLISFEEDASLTEQTAAKLAIAIAKSSSITSLSLIWQGEAIQDDIDLEDNNDVDMQNLLSQITLARHLLEAIQSSATIQYLDLHSMSFAGDTEALLVGVLSKLSSLRLFDDWNRRDLRKLFQCLHRTATLENFHLIGVDMDIIMMEFLSSCLASNSSITAIAFSGCGISDEGVKAFVRHWPSHSNIHWMEWSSNVIQGEGALLLIESAGTHLALKQLHLVGNDTIGYEGLANIALQLPSVLSLSHLTVSICLPEQVVMEPEFQPQRELVGALMTQGMKANTHLLKLDVSGSAIYLAYSGIAEELDFYMSRNECLPFVPLLQQIPTLWCEIFSHKFIDDASLIYYFFRLQPSLWPLGQVDASNRTAGLHHNKKLRKS